MTHFAVILCRKEGTPMGEKCNWKMNSSCLLMCDPVITSLISIPSFHLPLSPPFAHAILIPRLFSPSMENTRYD
jgi:hypothetical protein